MKMVRVGGVYEGGNVIDADRVRRALEHAGIPAVVRGEGLLAASQELPVRAVAAVCMPAVCGPGPSQAPGGLPRLMRDVLIDAPACDARNGGDAGPSCADLWPVGTV